MEIGAPGSNLILTVCFPEKYSMPRESSRVQAVVQVLVMLCAPVRLCWCVVKALREGAAEPLAEQRPWVGWRGLDQGGGAQIPAKSITGWCCSPGQDLQALLSSPKSLLLVPGDG